MTAKLQRGFTVLELIIAIVLVLVAGTIFYVQKRDLEVAKRDELRKTAINAMYYNLEDIFYPTNQYYPEALTADVMKGLDPELLKDPSGKAVSEQDGTYRYEPKDCAEGKCRSYTLRADLEHEADYEKLSRNK